MVEAPRIRILYEKIKSTIGKYIINANGPSYKRNNVDLVGSYIREWWYAGKYIYALVINHENGKYVIRTHMMMYGRIIINDDDKVNNKLKPFMTLIFDDNTKLIWYLSQINIINPICKVILVKSNYREDCSGKIIYEDSFLMQKYDISNRNFDINLTVNHIYEYWLILYNDIMVDILLNQKFFPGVGNILQQEALYRCCILPTRAFNTVSKETIFCLIDKLKIVTNLLYESYINSYKDGKFHSILLIYRKKYCPQGHKTIQKYLGYRNRRTTYCLICQS